MNRAIHIYGLTHPQTGDVWYVGASGHPSLRVRQHRAKGAAKRVRTWIASLSSPPTKVILETATLDNWQERERYWIADMKGKNPSLLNEKTGGGGRQITIKPELTRQSLWLNPETLAALKRMGAKIDRPVGWLLRKAAEEFVERQGKAK